MEGSSTKHILISNEYDGEGADFFKLADQMGLEGIVSKRKGSTYTSGPTQSWLKTKCWHTDTFDVTGVDKGSDGIPYALSWPTRLATAARPSFPSRHRSGRSSGAMWRAGVWRRPRSSAPAGTKPHGSVLACAPRCAT
ncbi:hypothetical protein [Devosia sp. LjRoot3]|uniref:hypothetical protein n=1 Tax=Devosia sp. LjRoot3 TaxID=3342319 RepID=UPI003F4FABF9